MFSSALRRQAHSHLRCNYHSRYSAGGGSLVIIPPKTTTSNTEERSPCVIRTLLFANSRRFINTRNTIDSLRRHSMAPVQTAYFSSSEGERTKNEIKPKLMVNVNKELPEIYQSPSALLEEISYNQIVHLDCKSIDVVDKDDKEEKWHTATYVDKRTNEHFHSGKFGELLNKIGQNNNDHLKIPSLSSEETVHIHDDGTVYHRSENAAKEAAASRVLDCLAFRLKYSNVSVLTDNYNNDDENALVPLRYCVELPYLFPASEVGDGGNGNVAFNMDPWPCLMAILSDANDDKVVGNAVVATNNIAQGTVYNEKETVVGKTKTLSKVFHCATSITYDGVWFTSTFVDNDLSDEGFSSGIMRVNPDLYHPCKVRIDEDDDEQKVYYKGDIRSALDSASARAIDCYNFRHSDQNGKKNPVPRLCYEKPYTAEQGASKFERIDYITILGQRGELLTRMHKQIESTSPDKKFLFGSYAISSPHLLHLPKKFLLNVFKRRNVQGWHMKFTVHSVQLEAKFYSATFKDPMTKEVFRSGLGCKALVDRHPRVKSGAPLHLAEARIEDGKVYYRTKKLAEHAAAARAIDCYIFRELKDDASMIGADTEKLKLCHEEPYESESERDAQQVDYAALMAKRGGYVKKKHRVVGRPRHRKRKRFATVE